MSKQGKASEAFRYQQQSSWVAFAIHQTVTNVLALPQQHILVSRGNFSLKNRWDLELRLGAALRLKVSKTIHLYTLGLRLGLGINFMHILGCLTTLPTRLRIKSPSLVQRTWYTPIYSTASEEGIRSTPYTARKKHNARQYSSTSARRPSIAGCVAARR